MPKKKKKQTGAHPRDVAFARQFESQLGLRRDKEQWSSGTAKDVSPAEIERRERAAREAAEAKARASKTGIKPRIGEYGYQTRGNKRTEAYVTRYNRSQMDDITQAEYDRQVREEARARLNKKMERRRR